MSEGKKEFELRPVNPDNFERYSEIYDACFGMKVGRDFFRWKYLENPSGPVVAFEAVDGDRVAAFYGIMPDSFTAGGREFRVYQSMDTMTHPDYQRLGLFSKTARATFQHVVAREKTLRMFGIPGVRALPGFVKLGWTHAHSFRLLFQHSRFISRLPRHLEIAELRADFAGWRDYFSARTSLTTMRQRKYSLDVLQWHVFSHPLRQFEVIGVSEKGRLNGFVVSRDAGGGRRLVHLVDTLHPEDRSTTGAALLSAVAERHRGSWIYAWEPTDPLLRRAYNQHWFLANPLGKGPFCHQVPLILHHLGEGSEGSDWINAAGCDWQAMNQD